MATLKKWTHPRDYAGENPTDHYLVMSVHRDSSTLERSNWQVALDRLGYTDQDDDGVYIMHCSHWAVGWIDHLLVHESASDKVHAAQAILEDLDQYPVLDEEHWSELEDEEICDYWESASQWERADWYTRAGVDVDEDQDLPDELADAPERVRDYIRDRWD